MKRVVLASAIAFLLFAACAPPSDPPTDPAAGVASAPSVDTAADEAILREMHATVLCAHLENDVDSWLATEAESFVSANRGEIRYADPETRRRMREPYLESVRFTTYRDLREPIVEVSDDGTLGWVIVEVELSGVHTADDGSETPIEGVFAWIELYRKQDGRWLCVGNVSNARPAS